MSLRPDDFIDPFKDAYLAAIDFVRPSNVWHDLKWRRPELHELCVVYDSLRSEVFIGRYTYDGFVSMLGQHSYAHYWIAFPKIPEASRGGV